MIVGLGIVFVHLVRFSILCAFWICLDCFVFVLFAFVVLGLVSVVVCQKIGWGKPLQNYLFCVEWDVKP